VLVERLVARSGRFNERQGSHRPVPARSAPRARAVSRRHFLKTGLAGVASIATAAVVGLELVDRGVLGGRSTLEQLPFDPGCWTAFGGPACRAGGATQSGSFYSKFRRTQVGYTVGYPPGHGPGSRLPLIVMLHGFHGSHRSALAGLTPQEAVSLTVNGAPLTPMALVTVDGGGGYWHPHPHDDPMGMVVHELIPMLQHQGLGVAPHRIATMGISMGGYGAIAFAEHYPHLFSAVAAISPAIFTTYGWVHYVNPGAYWGPGDFARYDAITHTSALQGIPVRVTTGFSDPFFPWVEELVAALPAGAVVDYAAGGHTGTFFHSQEPPSLTFLSRHLAP
jgi:pimeloyl-ACP methyl ester carboxylesterase